MSKVFLKQTWVVGYAKSGLPGQGKSGSTRTLVAHKHQNAIFLLAGRKKNQPGSDFSDEELSAVKIIARGLQLANTEQLGALLTTEVLKEICHVKNKDEP